MVVKNPSLYVLENSTPVTKPECLEAFSALESREKQYLHYLSQASWYGSTICLFQCSLEAPVIFVLLDNHFRNNENAFVVPAGLVEEEFKAFLVYAAGFYANMGNYKGFGDSKFVPGCSEAVFETILESGPRFAAVKGLYEKVKAKIFSLEENELLLGLGGSEGVTSYFSRNCVRSDAEKADRFMRENKICAENTRLVKRTRDGKDKYTILLASEEKSNSPVLSKEFEGAIFEVIKGDYAPLLKRVNYYLEKALEHVGNENEKLMVTDYIESFKTGSLDKHKDGSRHWIRNKGPVVECYIGFIETYRDPFGTRAEFEGFVAVVNKPVSAKFGNLVENAEKVLPLLPWPKEFEKDKFLRPDFTSLDVICYGASGIPAGINIPNYDDIRQDEGFKNVALGNIINAVAPSEVITFVTPEDAKLLKEYKGKSYDIQVALHELLGHGSGKLFSKKDELSALVNPLDGSAVRQCYKDGETYDSVFTSLGSSYEECRAECVGIYLCNNADVLSIFGHAYGSEEASNVIYVNWLTMARAGLLGLQFYDPNRKSWGQAHMQARFGILQVMLEAGEEFVKIKKIEDADEKGDDLLLTMDKSKIESVGREAVGVFLRKLQVYKAMADIDSAKSMYGHYTTPDDTFLGYREIVLARKQPRKENVMPNTVCSNGNVSLVEYEASHKGLIESFVDRFDDDPSITKDISEMWLQYSEMF